MKVNGQANCLLLIIITLMIKQVLVAFAIVATTSAADVASEMRYMGTMHMDKCKTHQDRKIVGTAPSCHANCDRDCKGYHSCWVINGGGGCWSGDKVCCVMKVNY